MALCISLPSFLKTKQMKKLILAALFILSTLIISATNFSIIAKPGLIKFNGGTIILNCEDHSYDNCDFDLDLPFGSYLYISKKDTATIIVDTTGVYELGEAKNNILRIIQ